MRRLSAWFRSHPLTTIFLLLIGFVVGTHLLANWRAEVRWQRYCAAARARGVKLTLAEFAPPEIPDAENFAKIPMLRAISTGGVQSPLELPLVNNQRPDFGNAMKGERIDWKAWQKFFQDAGYIAETTDDAPRDVLRALEHYAPQFSDWSEWRARPRCRFPLDLTRGFALPLTHLNALHDAAKIFALRLRAHLAVDDSAAAYADFEDGFQIHRALLEEPTLISRLVQISSLLSILDAAGEGLRDHVWDEPEIGKLAGAFEIPRVWEDYRFGIASERGFQNWTGDLLADSTPAKRAALLGTMSPSLAGTLFFFVPKRVFRDNQLRSNQYLDEMLARVSPDALHFDLDGPLPSGPEQLNGWFDPYYFFLLRMSAPGFSELTKRFVHLQTQLYEARLACALERCSKARAAFPESLADLVPDFIAAVPVDTYSRQPLRYRRADGGTFLLYGVGQNRTDDGGALDSKHTTRPQLDDVWLYAPPPSK